MFERILEEIRSYPRIILHRHSNPDGDALGSQIGLKHLLLDHYPEKEVFVVGDDAKRYSFMEDSEMDTIPDSVYVGALAIILDTSATSLISDQRYTLAARTVTIDHHIPGEKFADVEVVDTSFESCCGLITQLAMESGFRLSPLAAKSLFTGMVTDSGRFRYDSVSTRTFRLASFLMEQPFDTADLYTNLYADDFDRVRLRATFVLKIQTTAHAVAYIYTTLAEREAIHADAFSISRGMVNTMADIRGIDIWVNFTETDKGILCEIRSSKYNINPVAVKYGGGGHAKASGATLQTKEEAMHMLADLDKIGENSHA